MSSTFQRFNVKVEKSWKKVKVNIEVEKTLKLKLEKSWNKVEKPF